MAQCSDGIKLVSYNLRGLNSGRSMLSELCNDPNVSLIAVQEHWLTPNNLHLLSNVHPDFDGFGISAMTHRLSSCIYNGRPYGGVGFLWRKSLSGSVRILNGADNGRCLCAAVNLNGWETIKIINVYFPCYSTDSQYSVELGDCLGFIENEISQQDNAIVIGDVNFTCTADNQGFQQSQSVFDNLTIYNCDNLFADTNPVTYANDQLDKFSFIDHCFASNTIRKCISNISILESGANLSDHRPIVVHLLTPNRVSDCNLDTKDDCDHPERTPPRFTWRWDKSVLTDYYEASRVELSHLPNYDPCLCSSNCTNPEHCHAIDALYNDIVSALFNAASSTVVRLPNNSLKPYWNDELDRLKESAILWHDIWMSMGKPKSGQVFNLKCSTHMKYKLAIRDSYLEFENEHNDDLLAHFLDKRTSEFWKSWNAKFRKNINKDISIDGCRDSNDIANKFADFFRGVYSESSVCNESASTGVAADGSAGVHDAPAADTCKLSDVDVCQLVTVETIEACIHKLAKGKACGPDELSAEHLVYAHPSLVVALAQLFKMIIMHRHVPNEFGRGIIIPLIKDKSRSLNELDNYRAITLIPIVSKVFESVILTLFEEVFVVDELQFGFKRGIGCADAIFALKTVVSFFNKRGSSVFLASLDIKKRLTV